VGSRQHSLPISATEELHRMPKGFWKDADNKRRFLNDVAEDLNITEVSILSYFANHFIVMGL